MEILFFSFLFSVNTLHTTLGLSKMSPCGLDPLSGESRVMSTNSIIRSIWKVLGLSDSLLERKCDLYRSLLHLAQLMRSCAFNMRSLLGEMWESCQKEMQDDGMPGKERKVGMDQSINSLSDDRGGFLLTCWLSDIEINDCATAAVTKTHLLIPLAIYLSTVFHLSFSLCQEALTLAARYSHCVFFCACVCFPLYKHIFVHRRVLAVSKKKISSP